VDSVFSHLGWVNADKKEGGLGPVAFPLVGDLGAKIGKKFGFYSCEAGHHFRGTAIIDPDGTVLHLSQNHPDVGRNVDETLRLVKGYQFARAHGQVCPAKWHEGEATIKPTPKDSKEYFGHAAAGD
jgi:alkyl hydroperoxide reductase subunit AhpC